jgi:hypothetical protein
MFDPNYAPADEPLDAKDAIIAMVQHGATLYDRSGKRYWYSHDSDCFLCAEIGERIDAKPVVNFSGLYYGSSVPNRKRLMTRWEILAWVNSDESRGWVVQMAGDEEWFAPQCLSYNVDIDIYRRALLLPDLSGIDESTIQVFEVEE